MISILCLIVGLCILIAGHYFYRMDYIGSPALRRREDDAFTPSREVAEKDKDPLKVLDMSRVIFAGRDSAYYPRYYYGLLRNTTAHKVGYGEHVILTSISGSSILS